MRHCQILCLKISIICLAFGFLSNSVVAQSKGAKILNYQEVFYHFYRKDELNAIISLTAGIESASLPGNIVSNNLLLGSMYYMYGLQDSAEKALRKMVNNNRAKASQRATAWFYLSKLYFDQGRNKNLAVALDGASKSLPASLLNEFHYLKGMYHVNVNQLGVASRLLQDIERDNFWYELYKFNLGTAYIRSKKGDAGIELIHSVGEGSEESEKILALQDKAKIVLGYYFLRNSSAGDAVETLQNVRLEGPFSHKALLGIGWAFINKKQFRKALVPWTTLAEKSIDQVTVQEAILAVPFAYKELGALDNSMRLYENAIGNYRQFEAELDIAIKQVKDKKFFNEVFQRNYIDDFSITESLLKSKDSTQGKLLIDMLAQKEFQVLFNIYRDLQQLKSHILDWSNHLASMEINLGLLPEDQNFALSDKPRKRPFVKTKRYYEEAVLTLTDRIKLQDDRLNILLGMYETFMQEQILSELNKRKEYIVTYLSQSRFALAELLDEAQGDIQ